MSFDAPPRGTRTNIRTYLIFLGTRIIDLIFRLIIWVYLHPNFSGELRKTIFICNSTFRPFKFI